MVSRLDMTMLGKFILTCKFIKAESANAAMATTPRCKSWAAGSGRGYLSARAFSGTAAPALVGAQFLGQAGLAARRRPGFPRALLAVDGGARRDRACSAAPTLRRCRPAARKWRRAPCTAQHARVQRLVRVRGGGPQAQGQPRGLRSACARAARTRPHAGRAVPARSRHTPAPVMDTAFRASIAGTIVLEPPISPTLTSFPPLRSAPEAEIEARARTHEIHHRRGAAAGRLQEGLQGARVAGVDHFGRARLARRSHFARSGSATMGATLHSWRAIRMPDRPTPPAPRTSSASSGASGPPCAGRCTPSVRRKPGAGLLVGNGAVVHQVAGMRHHHVGREAAVASHAQRPRRAAQVLLPRRAQRAGPQPIQG